MIPSPTIGILYPGEMGASLAALLSSRGLRVVTTLAGRGGETVRRCRESGIVVLDTLADVVHESDILFSLVPPAAAEEVVNAYCEHAHRSPAGSMFVDANSIRPELVIELAKRVASCGRDFVDAGINGLAKNLTTSGTIYLSGTRAGEVAKLFGDSARVRVLHSELGRASTMKMLLAGLSKGVCALFVELALVARQRGMLEEMMDASAEIYPGISVVVERMLPTYAKHAQRRATEMQELEQTAFASGLEPCVIAAIRSLHDTIADVSLNALSPSPGTPGEGRGGGYPESLNPHPNPPPEYRGREKNEQTPSAKSIIERLAAARVLVVEPSVGIGKQSKE